MTAALPWVSCIMPTTLPRLPFVWRALKMFAAQDYAKKQLFIICEEQAAVALAADWPNAYPSLENVVTICDARLSIGAKRNIACERAEGELIAHWDDDDWHSPRRLSTQVQAMREQGARLCGADRLVFYDERHGCAWLFQTVRKPWLAGGTLIYERTLWREQPFIEVSDGEDTAFVDAAVKRGAKVATITDPSLYVAILHGGNTTQRTINAQWGGFDARVAREWMNAPDKTSGVIHARP